MKIVSLFCLVLVFTQGYLVNTKINPKYEQPKGTVQDVGLLTEGLFLGFFKQLFPLQECISDSSTIIEDFEKAYFYLKQGKEHLSPSDIAEAFKYVGDAALKLPSTLSECGAVAGIIPEITKIALVFSNPATAVTKIGSAIFWHGFEITKDVRNAVGYWEQKDFLKFGEMIGRIAALTIGKPKSVVSDIGQVIEGLLYGFFKQSFPIQECIDDTKIVIDDFEKAYHYFKSGKDHLNPSDISEALKYAGDAIKKFPAALSKCESVAGILGEIGKIVHTFSNPASFITKIGKAIIFHGKEITGDLKDAVNFWEAKDFFHFGEKVGIIAKITIAIPIQKVNNAAYDIGRMVEGVLYGFIKQEFDIHDCIDDTKILISDFDTVYDNFKSGVEHLNPIEIAEALKYAGEALQKLPSAVHACKQAGDVIGKIESITRTFSNPLAFLF